MSDKEHVSPKDFIELINDEEVKKTTELKLPSRTDEELKNIARDVCQGIKFITNDPETLQLSFGMLLMFMEEVPANLGSMYGEMKDAAPRSINGMPMFFSAGMLNIEDTKKVAEYIKKIEDAMKAI